MALQPSVFFLLYGLSALLSAPGLVDHGWEILALFVLIFQLIWSGFFILGGHRSVLVARLSAEWLVTLRSKIIGALIRFGIVYTGIKLSPSHVPLD